MSFPLIFTEGEKLQKALENIDNIIDKDHQSVKAVVGLLTIEAFGSKDDSDIAFKILGPIKEKFLNA